MSKTEDLKATAQLRKALLPLVELLKADVNAELTKRLDQIETALTDLAKRDVNVEVKAPEVIVNMPVDGIVAALEKQNTAIMQKSDMPVAQEYQPHDQSGGAIKYGGFVAKDGSWYIQRLAKGQQRYARGKGDYQDAWAKKSKLNYGIIDGSK